MSDGVNLKTSQPDGCRFDPLARGSFCVELPCPRGVLLLQQSKNVYLREIGNSKLTVTVSVNGCLSFYVALR